MERNELFSSINQSVGKACGVWCMMRLETGKVSECGILMKSQDPGILKVTVPTSWSPLVAQELRCLSGVIFSTKPLCWDHRPLAVETPSWNQWQLGPPKSVTEPRMVLSPAETQQCTGISKSTVSVALHFVMGKPRFRKVKGLSQGLTAASGSVWTRVQIF